MASFTSSSTTTTTTTSTNGESKSTALSCKWGKVTFEVDVESSTTVGDLKQAVSEETSIDVTGVKLLNLKIKKRTLNDACLVTDCKVPKVLKIMGTASAHMLTDVDLTDLPEVLDDINLETMMGDQLGNAGAFLNDCFWFLPSYYLLHSILHIHTYTNLFMDSFFYFFYKHCHTGETYQKLVAAISKTPIKLALMNEPRAGKKLLVLDLDHTILDFKNATQEAEGFVDFGMFPVLFELS